MREEIKMKEFTSVIKIEFSDTREAENIKDYKELVKESFSQDYNLILKDKEITEIKQNDFMDL